MNPLTLRTIALQLLILLGTGFGIVCMLERPEARPIWLAGMLTVPISWALVAGFGLLRGSRPAEHRRQLLDSLLLAAVVIAAALGAQALDAVTQLPGDWPRRFGMVVTALVLVVIGNGLPKKREPGCSPSRSLAIQRLVGWTFVLGGLALTVCWLLVPDVDEALGVITVALYAAMAAAIAIGLWRIRRPTELRRPDG